MYKVLGRSYIGSKGSAAAATVLRLGIFASDVLARTSFHGTNIDAIGFDDNQSPRSQPWRHKRACTTTSAVKPRPYRNKCARRMSRLNRAGPIHAKYSPRNLRHRAIWRRPRPICDGPIGAHECLTTPTNSTEKCRSCTSPPPAQNCNKQCRKSLDKETPQSSIGLFRTFDARDTAQQHARPLLTLSTLLAGCRGRRLWAVSGPGSLDVHPCKRAPYASMGDATAFASLSRPGS